MTLLVTVSHWSTWSPSPRKREKRSLLNFWHFSRKILSPPLFAHKIKVWHYRNKKSPRATCCSIFPRDILTFPGQNKVCVTLWNNSPSGDFKHELRSWMWMADTDSPDRFPKLWRATSCYLWKVVATRLNCCGCPPDILKNSFYSPFWDKCLIVRLLHHVQSCCFSFLFICFFFQF